MLVGTVRRGLERVPASLPIFTFLWLLDWVTTALVLANGGLEANSAMAPYDPLAMLGWKVLTLTGILTAVAVTLRMHKAAPIVYQGVFLGLSILLAAVNAWNLRNLTVLL